MRKENAKRAGICAYNAALRKGLYGQELAAFMFLQGMKFQDTGEIIEDPLDAALRLYDKPNKTASEKKKGIEDISTSDKMDKETIDITDWA